MSFVFGEILKPQIAFFSVLNAFNKVQVPARVCGQVGIRSGAGGAWRFYADAGWLSSLAKVRFSLWIFTTPKPDLCPI